MCLNSVNYTLHYDKKEKDFIGYGYKALKKIPTMRKWKEAKFHTTKNNSDQTIEREVPSNRSGNYPPGFHVFLKEEDARNYGLGNYVIVKVKFKGLISVGTNVLHRPFLRNYGKCIIARYMKVVEVL